jgi:hypothetical protein
MKQSRRKRRWLLALLLLLLCGGACWCAWPDARLAQARRLQQELSDPASRNLPEEERREKWRALREASKQLSPAQRQKLRADSRKRRQAEMARYFRMSEEEKARYLDEQIARMEKMRQDRQARGADQARGAGRSAGQTPSAGDPAPSDSRTVSTRDERRQDRLDATTPAERAQFTQYFHDLNERRAQLGLPASGRGFGPPR